MSNNYVSFKDVVREYHNGHTVRAADGISFDLEKGKAR
jgi:ABC-type oligopeptide transport system ATPase subunit